MGYPSYPLSPTFTLASIHQYTGALIAGWVNRPRVCHGIATKPNASLSGRRCKSEKPYRLIRSDMLSNATREMDVMYASRHGENRFGGSGVTTVTTTLTPAFMCVHLLNLVLDIARTRCNICFLWWNFPLIHRVFHYIEDRFAHQNFFTDNWRLGWHFSIAIPRAREILQVVRMLNACQVYSRFHFPLQNTTSQWILPRTLY